MARRGRPGPPEVHPVEDLHALLPQANVVILIAPHTPQTDRLIGASELALLPDGALLVNVARGKLVDTGALVAELSTGRIRAVLDVTDPGTPAGRASPSFQPARVLDLTARRRRELGLLPARGPADRRAAGPFQGRPAAREHRPGALRGGAR